MAARRKKAKKSKAKKSTKKAAKNVALRSRGKGKSAKKRVVGKRKPAKKATTLSVAKAELIASTSPAALDRAISQERTDSVEDSTEPVKSLCGG